MTVTFNLEHHYLGLAQNSPLPPPSDCPLLHLPQCFCILTSCLSGPAPTNQIAPLAISKLQILFTVHCSTFFTSFHSLGFLCHKCQSALVNVSQPGPRPLSLVPPTMLGAYANRDRPSSVHRTILMRTRSLPCHGLRFPAAPALDPIDGYVEDEYGLREYFC